MLNALVKRINPSQSTLTENNRIKRKKKVFKPSENHTVLVIHTGRQFPSFVLIKVCAHLRMNFHSLIFRLFSESMGRKYGQHISSKHIHVNVLDF